MNGEIRSVEHHQINGKLVRPVAYFLLSRLICFVALLIDYVNELKIIASISFVYDKMSTASADLYTSLNL